MKITKYRSNTLNDWLITNLRWPFGDFWWGFTLAYLSYYEWVDMFHEEATDEDKKWFFDHLGKPPNSIMD